LIDGLQNEIKANEKVIKLDYFWGPAVMVFSHPLFFLKYDTPYFYYAKLEE